MTPLAKQIVIVVGAGIALIVVIVAWNWGGDGAQPPAPAPDGPTAAQPDLGPQPVSAAPPAPDMPAPPPIAATAPAPTAAAVASAVKQFEQAVKLMEAGKIFEARKVMTAALFSNALPAQTAAAARKKLASAAAKTLLAPRIVDDEDPYVTRYTVQSGDALASIERRMELHVPTQLLCKVNGVSDPNKIRVGQTLKIIKGPFHAVLSLSNFTMDVYQKRKGLPYIYIKRMPIGTGKTGATPFGSYRVKLGGKMIRPAWYPPPNSGRTGRVLYGQPGYAFGSKGLWIGLEGTDRKTKTMTGYGIHSTNNPASIGRAESLGCVRMADADIDLAFALLYEHWSTVIIKK